MIKYDCNKIIVKKFLIIILSAIRYVKKIIKIYS